MKKIFSLLVLFFVLRHIALAQFDISIAPKSAGLPAGVLSALQEVQLPAFNAEEAKLLDYNDAKNGKLPLISRAIHTLISTDNTGTWSELGGGRLWRVKITSAGALGLVPLFDTLYLPQGATLHVYMPGGEEIQGAFTHDNTPEPTSFCTGLIHGESCVLEYFEPKAKRGLGIIHINAVGHAYRWVDPLPTKSGGTDRSINDDCEVNVACSEGDNWRNQIRSVARILVTNDDGNQGYCSGALINNVRQDCTPYFLSAQHCTGYSTSAASFAQWVFYFNFQAPTCAESTGPFNQTVNGCTKMADSNDDGGDYGSDFLLLKLKHSPSTTYRVYYSGWNANPQAPTSGVCIHHPAADIKKISTYSSSTGSVSWGGVNAGTHWETTWVGTANGHGITEPGSSGGPLYNQQGYIVGHLTGGNSCCTNGACGPGSGPGIPDDFGKLSFDWETNGINDTLRIKPWLDPDNTGTKQLAGMNPTCGTPVANDAGILSITAPNGNICSSVISPVVVLKNFGNNNIISVNITYAVDEIPNSYPWNGNLAPGGTDTVTLPDLTVTEGIHDFSAITSSPNGVFDSHEANDEIYSAFFVPPATGNLILHLISDNRGQQTTWKVFDSNSLLVASGGPYADVAGGAEYNASICLAPGCYSFTIYDSQSDGMTSGEDGAYTLSAASGLPVYATLSNPAFGAQETQSFCINATGIAETAGPGLFVVPNPSTGMFSLRFDNGDEKSIRVFDALGNEVAARKTTERAPALDLSLNSKGVYILQVQTPGGTAVRKLILQ